MAALSKNHTDQDLINYVLDCKQEAENAKLDRMDKNRINFDAYHMRHDFSHKMEGQSIETFSKVRMSVEQTKSFFQQSLADSTDGWFDIDIRDIYTSEEMMMIRPAEMKILLNYFLQRGQYYKHVGNSVQRGLLESLMITKVASKMIDMPKYESKGKGKNKRVVKIEDKTWELDFRRVRAQDYYPDPTGNKLYEIEEMEQDLHIVKQRAKDGMYSMEAVNRLSASNYEDVERQNYKRRETDQQETDNSYRPKVQIIEYWGDIVSKDGELLYENIVLTIGNERELIRKPTANPLWHKQTPYTVTPLIEVDGAVWPIALMDAPSRHLHVWTELFNLCMDGAFKHVHNVSQIRDGELSNPEQVADGIKPGTKLKVKSTLPPGAKVMEPLEETSVPNDAMNMLNMLENEFQQSSLSSALRSGGLPHRAVKATEVVEQSQSINNTFNGMTKNIEASHIPGELEMATMMIAQNWDMIAKEIFISLFGDKRGTELYRMDAQDVFVSVVQGFAYRVHGITQALTKAQDFQKITTALQTIGNAPMLTESFVAQYDPKKILNELLKALNIDTEKIKLNQTQSEMIEQPQGGGAPQPGTAPNAAPAPAQQAPSPLSELFGAGEASNPFQG